MKTFRHYTTDDIADFIINSSQLMYSDDCLDSDIIYYTIGVTPDGELTEDIECRENASFTAKGVDVYDWLDPDNPTPEDIYNGFEDKDHDAFWGVCVDLVEQVNEYLDDLADEDDEDDEGEDDEG